MDSKKLYMNTIKNGSEVRNASLTRTVAAGAVGNVLEWYDFGLFGYFAPVIAKQFLPLEDPVASLLGAFGVFATGFLMRPLGGLVFGYIGDRMGRKLALELSVLLMAGSTTILGFLPSYSAIGLFAPFLLTLIRMLQGLSVGGEYIGSMSFLAEHAPPGRRAFLGSWTSFTVALGSLLGSGVAAMTMSLLSESQLNSWGWRVPFLSGLAIGVIGFWLRLGVKESPSFETLKQQGGVARNPIAETLRNDGGAILTTLGLSAISSVGFYIPFVWLPTWLSQINKPPLAENLALLVNTLGLVLLIALTPLSALASDKVGRRPMFLASSTGYIVLSYPIFLLMRSGNFSSALLGGLSFALINGFLSGCLGATLVELFPTRTRYTGVAIGYNVGQALLGGTAPLIATMLIRVTGNPISPAFYLVCAGATAFTASLFIKPRHGSPLE
jgi:MFS transporter, MHS family, proline/betaine transporter